MSYDVDALVIGAGPGGYPCAIRLGQLGVSTLIVDRGEVGGVCLNVGCIPSKALISGAKRYHDVQHAGRMGVRVSGEVSIDFPALQAYKAGIVSKLTGGVAKLLKANGAVFESASASLVGPHSVRLTAPDGSERTVSAEHIVLATGSSPIVIPGFELGGPILDSTGALALEQLPERLVVIGGGVIGLELGQLYAMLGVEVTVVEMTDQLLPGIDLDAVRLVQRRLKKLGVRVHLTSRALGWEADGSGAVVQIDSAKKGRLALPASHVLVTVGRRPNTAGLGLEALGVKLDRGRVLVDDQLRTAVPSVFAIGDIVRGPMLAHKATHEAEVVAEVIAGKPVFDDARVIPAVVYTEPEVAVAGMGQAQAQARGEVIVGKVPFAAIGRALTAGDSDGFVKVVADATSKRILGVTIVGAHASDLISEAVLAIELGAEAADIGLSVHPHPSLGEGMMEAAKAALGEAIHIINR